MFITEIHGYSPKPPHGQSSPLALLSFSFLEKGKPGSHYYLGTSWARPGIDTAIQWARRIHILMRCYHVAMVSFGAMSHPVSFSKEREKRGSTYNAFRSQKYSIWPPNILYHMLCTVSRKFHYFSIEIIFIPSTTSFSLCPRSFLR